jgi:ubiquinone/menaquinone biosynthesis C-methylase UbiE
MAQPTQHFVPKQLAPRTPEVLSELCHPATCNIAEVFLKAIVTDQEKSPSLSSWVVHDNACGYGEVTRALLNVASGVPVDSIDIIGTDNEEAMVKGFQEKLKDHRALKHNAKISAELQDATSLKFPDDHFTHSFTNFLINSGPMPDQNGKILSEIWRTLRPGGIAVITNWNRISFADAITDVHNTTRAEDGGQLLMGMGGDMLKPEYLLSMVERAGFERSKMTILSQEVVALAPWTDEKARTRYLGLMWSVLGGTTAGWSKQDEESWDAALKALEDKLSASGSKGVVPNDRGQLQLPMESTIVIARK